MSERIASLEEEVRRLRTLLERTVRLASERDVAPVGAQALDAILAVLQAQRGFVGVVDGEGWRLVAGRELGERDIPHPESVVSRTVIATALRERRVVLETNAVDGDLGAMASVSMLALRSLICLPIVDGRRPIGFVYLDDPRFIGHFDAAAVRVVESWLPVVGRSLANALAEHALRDDSPFPDVRTRSPLLLATLVELARVAAFDAPVLLTGETGTGKSLIAREIHRASPRADGPFVHVNCGAIPEGLVEGELFGTVKGAFTGAESRAGRFEAARKGTLFLDELDSMPVACQAKLLVAVQEGVIQRLGSNDPIRTDVRVIAAMNSDPAARIATGELREDLYYRLALVDALIPALRDRPEDIPLLAASILRSASVRFGLPPLTLAPTALAQLLHHAWPGNVRELENALQRAALLHRDGVIHEVRLVRPAPGGPIAAPTRRRYGTGETDFVAAWRASGSARECAHRLGVSERTVFRLKQKYGVE